ncbi:MAG: hypothetical protein SFU99_18095 [Saprospiraceae bacterium]|nr:hypothetical protein [Saprospiraceae bacterium]
MKYFVEIESLMRILITSFIKEKNMNYLIIILCLIIFQPVILLSQNYVDQFEKELLTEKYGSCLNILESEFRALLSKEFNVEIEEISLLLRQFLKLEENCYCEEKEETSECFLKNFINKDSKYFIENLFSQRGYNKFGRKDFYGCISDFEIVIERTSSNDVKGTSYQMIGMSHLMLRNNEKGCKFLSKATEYGNKKSLEMIQNYCN